MAVADRTLMLKLIADVNQPTKQMKGLGASLKKAGAAAKSWGKAFAGALVIGGIEKVVDSLDDALAGFREGEDAARTLGQTWKNLGRDADQLGGVIDRIGGKAIDLGFDDAEVLRAFNTFLAKTGSVKDSTQGVQAAMNLARAKGISFARAVKIVTGSLGDLGPELRRNKEQARRWAKNHPLEVTLGKISDDWESFVGFLSQGKIDKALTAVAGIGQSINDLLFGTEVTKGGKTVRTKGLIDQFTAVGGKIVDAILSGLVDLGGRLQTVWDEQIATVDWAKAIPDALSKFWDDTLEPFLTNLADKGPVAAGSIVAIAVALGVLAAPAIAASLPIIAVAIAVGLAVGAFVLLLDKLPAIQKFFQDVQTGVQNMVNDIVGFFTGNQDDAATAATDFANAWAGPLIERAQAVKTEITGTLQDVIDAYEIMKARLQATKIPGIGRIFATGFQAGGIVTRPTLGLLGEAGPEAVVPLDRAGPIGGITVNITTGVGDPVAIGREVDRVLRAWRSRSGTAAV